jgi:hypothetical protein
MNKTSQYTFTVLVPFYNEEDNIYNLEKAFAGYLKRIGVTPTQDEATQPAEQSTTSTPTVKKTPYSGPSSRIDYADKTFEQALESGAYDAKPVAKNEEDIDEYIKQFL